MANEKDLDKRLDFFGIGASDFRRFPRIKRLLARFAPRVLERFYAKVQRHPHTASFFSDRDHMARAKAAQLRHWANLFSKPMDADYLATAERIGLTHARIGLEPQWYVGAYASVIEELILKIAAPFWMRMLALPGRAKTTATFVKAAMFDMEVAISTYIKAEEQGRMAVIAQLGEALSALAEGDLTVQLTGLPDSFRQIETDFENMRQRIGAALKEVSVSAGAINAGASEIRAASDDLANRTERQAASLEETAAAMSELTAKVKEAAEGANEMTTELRKAEADAKAGGTVLDQAIKSMTDIQSSAIEIGKIVDIIDGIAFQTNLLALNAGVEAARAGDSGKGFAVVANEVRALAQRSAEAASSIKSLIQSSVGKVEEGAKLVTKSGDVFQSIVSEVSEITVRAGFISEISRNQSLNLQQVDLAVQEMDQMTQSNAAMVEQANAASRSLETEAGQMDGLVRRFRISDGRRGNEGRYRKAA